MFTRFIFPVMVFSRNVTFIHTLNHQTLIDIVISRTCLNNLWYILLQNIILTSSFRSNVMKTCTNTLFILYASVDIAIEQFMNMSYNDND